MKHFLVSVLFLIQFSFVSKAQWVTIPDTNFAVKLQQLIPSCMSGNQMDTTCPLITTWGSLTVSNLGITDLTGIKYFSNLNTLNCQNNQLSALPNLPLTLQTLQCSGNLFNSISNLPPGLKSLNCYGNQINSLVLPDSLVELNCAYNQLASLPALPSALERLYCENNLLSALPALPVNLTHLSCMQNSITSLPAFPLNLFELNCSNNQLVTLPPLPSLLKKLYCNNSLIANISALPDSLEILECHTNSLNTLPVLPSGLIHLNCSSNFLNGLPALPASLVQLYCSENQLTSLPTLPSALNVLVCGYNQLSTLPTLLPGLETLDCRFNQISGPVYLPPMLRILRCENNLITGFPSIPGTLESLDCSHNLITSLGRVPNVMDEFVVNNNNIYCVENVPEITSFPSIAFFDITFNLLSCIPNHNWVTQNYYSYSVCNFNDTINNPNDCPGSNIQGNVFTDLNSNCVLNNLDLRTNNLPVRLSDNQNNLLEISYTIDGFYSFSSLTPDTFLIQINDAQLPVAIDCGLTNVQNAILDSSNQTLPDINIPVTCDTVYDAFVQHIVFHGNIFPGQHASLKAVVSDNQAWFNLDCGSLSNADVITITVSGPANYLGPLPGALVPVVNGNTFTYNVSNIGALSPSDLLLDFLIDSLAQAGEQICIHVTVDPLLVEGDTVNNTGDFCYTVGNSYDPNMKEVYPKDVLPGYNDWFTYTIHFQNTGTAPAFNIRLRDTLNTNLDVNTFEFLGASHQANTSVNGHNLTVRFNNILLPDSTTNYEGSMGYYQYRIKPLPGLPVGTDIENTAYIYFDFNPAIATNTTHNYFDITIADHTLENQLNYSLYPNPSSGVFTFKENKNIRNVEVYNLFGEEIMHLNNTKQIDLSAYPKGIYIAKINGQFVSKLVKD